MRKKKRKEKKNVEGQVGKKNYKHAWPQLYSR